PTTQAGTLTARTSGAWRAGEEWNKCSTLHERKPDHVPHEPRPGNRHLSRLIPTGTGQADHRRGQPTNARRFSSTECSRAAGEIEAGGVETGTGWRAGGCRPLTRRRRHGWRLAGTRRVHYVRPARACDPAGAKSEVSRDMVRGTTGQRQALP